MEKHRNELPIRLNQSFRPWTYHASHRRLILRSLEGMSSGVTTDVIFVDVVGMKLRARYGVLLIEEASEHDELDDFVDLPERHKPRYMRLLVSDENHSGYVVCGALHINEPGNVLVE